MKTKLFVFLFLSASIFPNLLSAQFVQQGPKLVGSGSFGSGVFQGQSVAISSDGNTAVVGGYQDNDEVGAVWVFIRSNGVWTQQGTKLVGSGGSVQPRQGTSVAISSDGNTVIVGGPNNVNNNSIGAVWIFTRSGGIWTQQGPNLVGTDAVGDSRMGCSVGISSDGNTAIVGGCKDNNGTGAFWVFTRSGSIWTQQGSKIFGSGAVGNSRQGNSVAISSDGNTAIEGGYYDNDTNGAVWIFIRSGSVWTQQGTKLVGTGGIGLSNQGFSVAISSDGNTAIEGGYLDNGNLSNGAGAVWVFTRSSSIWTQQGPKIVCSGSTGNPDLGSSVAISSDGNIAIVGGYRDNNYLGAAWIFTRSGNSWTQSGSKLIGSGYTGNSGQGFSVSITSDGNTAIVGGPGNVGLGAAWIFFNPLIGIQPISNEVPKNFSLSQNYPNPFNPSTVIKFQITGTNFVKLNVYDILGRNVAALVNEQLKSGTYEVNFDGTNLPSGIYFYRIEAGTFADSKQMVLVK